MTSPETAWITQNLDGEDRVVEVPKSAVPQWVRAGWLPTDPPEPEKPAVDDTKRDVDGEADDEPVAEPAADEPAAPARRRTTSTPEEN